MNQGLKRALIEVLAIAVWFFGLVIVMGGLSLWSVTRSRQTIELTLAAGYTLGFYFLARWCRRRYLPRQ